MKRLVDMGGYERGFRWRRAALVLGGALAAAGVGVDQAAARDEAAPGTAVASGAAAASSKVEGLQLVLERHENGSPKTALWAREAQLPLPGQQRGAGTIAAWGVVVIMYSEDGRQEGRVEAESCTFDRDRGLVTSEEAVSLSRDGVVVTGTGLEWNRAEERIRILKDAKLVFQRKNLAKTKWKGTK